MKKSLPFLAAIIALLLSASTAAAIDIGVTDAESVIGISRTLPPADALDPPSGLPQSYFDIYIGFEESSQVMDRELPPADALDPPSGLPQSYFDIYIGFAEMIERIIPFCYSFCIGDSDGDGVTDDVDVCVNTDTGEIDLIVEYPTSPWYGCGPSERNSDGDLDLNGEPLNDTFDNCPYVANTDPNDYQTDSNNDDIGDACQQDFDGDGKPDNNDNCPEVPNPNQENLDGDLKGDVCDLCPDDASDACLSTGVLVLPDEETTVENGAGSASVYIPAGAVSDLTTVEIIGETQTSNFAVGISANNIIVGNIYTFEPTPFTFNVPVTITLYYTITQQDGNPGENTLKIYYYDPINGWQAQVTTQDTTNIIINGIEYGGTLTLTTTHFSSYAVIALRDNDFDGVINGEDACPETGIDEAVDASGCSVVQLCESEDYKNHGQYVSCVSKTAETFLNEGLITEAEKDATVSEAAKSDVGKKPKK
jgi:hypothetical protein